MRSKILLLYLLLTVRAYTQSFKEYIVEYEAYCNEIVLDTIQQEGLVSYRHMPVKLDGDIDHYTLTAVDTVWVIEDCPQFKEDLIEEWPIDLGVIDYVDINYSRVLERSTRIVPLNSYSKTVYRDKICKCKRRPVIPFSNHFWNWIKMNK